MIYAKKIQDAFVCFDDKKQMHIVSMYSPNYFCFAKVITTEWDRRELYTAGTSISVDTFKKKVLENNANFLQNSDLFRSFFVKNDLEIYAYAHQSLLKNASEEQVRNLIKKI